MKTFLVVVLIFFCVIVHAQGKAPERKVDGNVITSERDPKVRIELPKSVQYAGADRWVLYDIADCELDAFVEADASKNVQALYWVQFEGYIPSMPELNYKYDSPRHTKIGDLDFFVDTWVRSKEEDVTPRSDREHIEGLLRTKGYRMPDGMMYVRLVHLLDEHKRRELMIIYGENLLSKGLTAVQLGEKGKAHDQWPAIEKGLVERARQKIAIQEAAHP